jgi:Protein of unknown function (DUF4065)
LIRRFLAGAAVSHEANVTYKVELAGGQRRLREAILYVATKGSEMEFLGGIKLNKILWRGDFRSYFHRQQPVTGRQYQRLKLGPAPVEMRPVISGMLRDCILKIQKRKVFGHIEDRPIALDAPVMRFFSPDDIEYLDESIKHYWSMTGTETSDESHGIAWRSRHDGDAIPYEAAFFEDATLPAQTLERFAKMGAKREWKSA